MKSRFISLLVACGCASMAHAQFNPVAITPGSYTYSIVVPATTVQPVPECVNAFVGSGTMLTDNTYYEQGLAAQPGNPGYNSGVPTHNTVFTNVNDPDMAFLMPPDYTTNNDLMVMNNPSWGSVTSGTFTFNTPTTVTNLAVLGTGGNGGCKVSYIVTHSDNSTDTGTITWPDWFNGPNGLAANQAGAWGCNGRMDFGGDFNNYGNGDENDGVPWLYSDTFTVSGSSPITSITFNYDGNNVDGVDNFFAVSGEGVGASTWTPIPVSGFNETALIPSTVPLPVTATMDNGTNINVFYGNQANNTWFEQGYYQAAPSDGLPPSGSTFTSVSQPTHTYQMGNYHANDAILIDTNNQTATITPVTPASYFAISFLTAGANGTETNLCILKHQDGVNETNTFYSYDWFNQNLPGAVAYEANGRVALSDRTLNNLGNQGLPFLFESYFPLNDTTSPVTNIVVMYESAAGPDTTTFIMAVSGSSSAVAPLFISEPPATQTWYQTQTATFSVQVSGTAPITNTWLVEQGGVYVPLADGVDANGSTISGAGTTTLTINDLTLADGTNYEYIASNAAGSVTSSPAVLIINTGTPVAPIIDSQFPTASFGVLTNHVDTTTFSVTIDASSTLPLSYQWYNGSTAIPGATSASYANVDTNAVTLSCVITNFVGAVTSSPVSVTIYAKPAPSPYQSAVLAYNPVAYWPLTETSGNIAFDYAGTNDGIYTGSYTLGQTGLPATAGIGANTSVGFDGSTAYVDIPVGEHLNITGPITLIEWVQPPSGGDTGFATSLGHSDESYRFDVAGGQPHFADDGPDIVDPNTINDGNWHQLVGVYDGTKQYLYVDGKLVGTPADSVPAGSADDVWIGGAPDYGTSRLFTGNIAQVAILNNALTAAEVEAIYGSLDTAPLVSITPASPTVEVGRNTTLTANLAGTPATSLQWYSIDTLNNSNNIAGATSSTYTITDASLSLNGYTYGVIAANPYGTNTASAVLSVSDVAAAGNISPTNAEAFVGAPVTYTVNADGSLPIYYQWIVNGTNVSGATNNSYSFSAVAGSQTIQVSFTNNASAGVPVLSSVANLQVDLYPTNITFNTNGTGWQLNTDGAGSVPTIETNVLELTDGAGSEGSSTFYQTAQYVGSFTASYTYIGDGSADGSAFIVQNASAGVDALGEPGGALGYYDITNSIALEFNLYTGNGEAHGMVAATNGETFADGGGSQYQPTGPVDVWNDDPINVTLNWANGVLSVSLLDTSTLATYSTNYTLGSITPILGGTDLGYIGFSGGDGGATSIQTVSNFQFNSVAPNVVLSVTPVTSKSFNIIWPVTDSGYVLQVSSSLSPASWVAGPSPTVVGANNVVTVNVADSGQQYYRLARVP